MLLDKPPAETVTDHSSSPAVRVDVGFFSAIGELGVVMSRPMSEQTAIEVGAGVGGSGLILSVMGKLRLGHEETRFTPGIGFSMGLPLPGISDVTTGDGGSPTPTAWLDLDLIGVEHRTQSGLVLSANAGLTVPLADGHWDIGDMGNSIEPLPQFRLGLGKAF